MTFVDWLTLVLLVLPLVDWLAVWALHRFHHWYPKLGSVRERRNVALGIAVLTQFFAILALARLGHFDLDDTLAATMIVSAVAGLSGINAAFLWRYRHALFGKPPAPDQEED